MKNVARNYSGANFAGTSTNLRSQPYINFSVVDEQGDSRLSVAKSQFLPELGQGKLVGN